MTNEPISKKPRADTVADDDLLLISQKQKDGSYLSKSVEASKLKSSNDTVEPAYITRISFSPDYPNNQSSPASAGIFLRRQLTSDSYTAYLYYKTRFYIPNMPQEHIPLITVKLSSIFAFINLSGNIVEYIDADIFSSAPQWHAASSRWYVDIKVIVPQVLFKSTDVGGYEIGVISDAMSLIEEDSAKRLNYGSVLSGFNGILPIALEGEVINAPQVLLSAL